MMRRIDYVIVTAEKCDSEQIAQIEKECFSSPWSVNQIAEEISKDNVIFLVAKKENTVLGYISGQKIVDEFYISNIAVKESFRNCHIASSVLEALIKVLKETDCIFATLEVRESNLTARKLYEKFGFRNLGVRKDFYSSPKENACIYTLYFNKEVSSD